MLLKLHNPTPATNDYFVLYIEFSSPNIVL